VFIDSISFKNGAKKSHISDFRVLMVPLLVDPILSMYWVVPLPSLAVPSPDRVLGLC
ncbi:unnamed protein product, partial [Musa textilis]